MSIDPNNPHNLAFMSRCLPGSPAELEEQERMAEFQRRKALQKEEELRNKPQLDAERHRKHLEACEANRARMRNKSTPLPRRAES